MRDSAIYNKATKDKLSRLYYLLSWKDYLEAESTWKPAATVIHFWKMMSTSQKDHLEKFIATSPLLDSNPPMAKSIVKLKQKYGRNKPAKSTKQAKKAWL